MSDASPEAEAAATLAQLQRQIAEARVELDRLRNDLATVRSDFDATHAAQLLEANEQLVLASLTAQAATASAQADLDELSRVAQRDGLTGLSTRALMLDRLDNALSLAERHGSRIAVMFVDLDDFKHINDTLGHAVGDAVLQWVARQLASAVRDSDTVSRYGGDEFLILLTELAHPADAHAIALKMQAAIHRPCDASTPALSLSASVGIALYPEHGTDATTLVHHADAAMYAAKRRGRGGVAFHR